MTKTRRTKEEIAALGNAIYNNRIRGELEPAMNGRFAAIDIETGQYTVDTDERNACVRLREQQPGSEIWLVRIGSHFLHRIGFGT